MISAIAAAATLVIALPVLRAPSDRLFGMPSAGWHRDPFVFMETFAGTLDAGPYTQPATDVPGGWLSALAGRVAGFNLLVLITFPLSAAGAYALARYLGLARAGASVAALAFSFSPFHLAQAAYHPHVAQTEWVPLYLLALWSCLDRLTALRVLGLVAAAAGIALSNFYAGLLAAVITPFAIAGHAAVHPGRWLRALATMAVLGLGVAAGVAIVLHTAPGVFAKPRQYGWEFGDLSRYGARWWSYLVPPVANPWLGGFAARLWDRVRVGELEQQVSAGWGLLALAGTAVAAWATRRRTAAAAAAVPLLLLVGAVAFVTSLAPDPVRDAIGIRSPSAWLYRVVPMFRAYARFSVAVQLMVVLLAGIAVDALRGGSRRARAACGVLLAATALEFAVWPGAMWRDVMPTQAHRWVMDRRDVVRAFDCTPRSWDVWSVEWLTSQKVAMFMEADENCAQPNLARKLGALGFSHVIVRRPDWQRAWLAQRAAEGDFAPMAAFPDGEVYAIRGPFQDVYTAGWTGFYTREQNAAHTWRWMGREGSWVVVNRSAGPVEATLRVGMTALGSRRQVTFLIDGREAGVASVGQTEAVIAAGPFVLAPGAHRLAFRPAGPPAVADAVLHNGDMREMTLSIASWTWSVRGASSGGR